MVKDIVSGSGSSDPLILLDFGNELFFEPNEVDSHGEELHGKVMEQPLVLWQGYRN